MANLDELEAQIHALTPAQVQELCTRLDDYQQGLERHARLKAWLEKKPEGVVPGVTTDSIMELMRGECQPVLLTQTSF